MLFELFGRYLIENNKIDEEQYSKLEELYLSSRVKLGLIAVAERMLTEQQAEEINAKQAIVDKKFGDIAIELGYLTAYHVSELLSKQGSSYMKMCQALSDLGIMNPQETERMFNAFVFDMDGIEVINELKADDVDAYTSLYLPEKYSSYEVLVQIAVRTISRIVSNRIYVEKAQKVSAVNHKAIAFQTMHGDKNVMFGMYSDDDAILKIAEGYAKFDFNEVDEDALDAVGEFINIINGLYATALSYNDSKVELDVPDYRMEERTVSNDNDICLMPVIIEGKKIYIFASVN